MKAFMMIQGRLYRRASGEIVEFKYNSDVYAICCEPGDAGGGMQSSFGIDPHEDVDPVFFDDVRMVGGVGFEIEPGPPVVAEPDDEDSEAAAVMSKVATALKAFALLAAIFVTSFVALVLWWHIAVWFTVKVNMFPNHPWRGTTAQWAVYGLQGTIILGGIGLIVALPFIFSGNWPKRWIVGAWNWATKKVRKSDDHPQV